MNNIVNIINLIYQEMEEIERKIEKINKKCINPNIILTRSIFLRSLALIYLFAFLSLYFQIQGLWGEEGLLPAKILLERIKDSYKENATFSNFPALIWFHEKINTNFLQIIALLRIISFGKIETLLYSQPSVDNTMFLLCIVGILISTGIVLNFSFALNPFGFFIMWIIYLNFFIIGQVFMSFQWDIFLLEIGFLTCFLCPWGRKKLEIISPLDELVFHLLRFLMFRFIYSNGIVKITAYCPTWLSFTTLNYHFQSQPLPNLISYYAHVYLADGVKKILTAFTFFLEIYAPFFFFMFSRRIKIFGGILQNLLQIGIIFTGNYNFFNLLTIVLNLSNFDDPFLRTFIPQKFLKFLDLDPLQEIYEYQNDNLVEEKKDKSEYDQHEKNAPPKEEVEGNKSSHKEEIMDDNQNIQNILKDKKLRKIHNFDHLTITDIAKHFFKTESIFFEIGLFVNLLAVCILITFYFIYPLKDLLLGNLKITTKEIENVYNKKFISYYVLFVFLYIFSKYAYHMANKFFFWLFENCSKYSTYSTYAKTYSRNSSIFSRISQVFFSVFSFFSHLFIFLFFIIYFLNATNVFYNSIDLQLADKNSYNPVEKVLADGLEYTENYFSRFRINHGYGLFRKITGINGRPELEIKIYNEKIGDWENFNFLYKMSDQENFRLKWNIPHQPRVDWQMWFSALANNINSEPWLVIMLGKILERNPVTLNMLGYYVEQAEFYHKCI